VLCKLEIIAIIAYSIAEPDHFHAAPDKTFDATQKLVSYPILSSNEKLNFSHVENSGLAVYNTVKGTRGKVSFDSQNDKHASQLSCDASPEVYLSHLIYQMTNALHSYPELQTRLR
jgi:hypothetical protein